MRKTALLFLSALLLTQPVMALTQEEAEQKIEELEKQRDEINQQIADLRAEYVEWKHYEDEFVSFDYPVRPYYISVTWFGSAYRNYRFTNPYSKEYDFTFSFQPTEYYETPDKRFECNVQEIDGITYYFVYDDSGEIVQSLNCYEVNDGVMLEVDVRISQESLPVGDRILESFTYELDVTSDMFAKKDIRQETIQENYYFTDDEIDDIEAVILMTEKYLSMDVTKDEVKDRIGSFKGPHIFSEAFDISFSMISDDDQKIRQAVRKLKYKLENQLPPKD